MNELYKLKELYKMYVKPENKKHRERIKELAKEELRKIHNTYIETIDFDRINMKIKYTTINNDQCYFYFSEATKKYYFNHFEFSY
jgi:hypothetical protein